MRKNVKKKARKAAGKLSVIYRSVNGLIPYAQNARIHNVEQIAQIIASIKEFGWTNPVLIDEDGGIIAGHGRVMAAKEMGMQKVPCIKLAGLSAEQRRALIIADNKIAENADWNNELLKLEIGALNAEEFDISLLGFDGKELEDLLGLLDEGVEKEPEVDLVEVFQVLVECKDEADQQEVFDLMTDKGYACKVQTL